MLRFLLLTLALGLAACSRPPAMVTQTTPVLRTPWPEDVWLTLATQSPTSPTPPLRAEHVLGAIVHTLPAQESALELRAVLDLEDWLRPNPCAEALDYDSEAVGLESLDVFAAAGSPWFEPLGLSPYQGLSTHLLVTLQSARVERAESTPEYETCCAEADCGVGFVGAVYVGQSHVHPAMALRAPSSPMVLVDRTGETLGLGLHEGRSFEGAVAVSFEPTR